MSKKLRTPIPRSCELFAPSPMRGPARARDSRRSGTVWVSRCRSRSPSPTRRESADNLNQLLADTITLRDLYKKHHWQVSGPTFYQLHLLFDKHFDEQSELVDLIAERIMMLGGVSVAMAADVAEMTLIPRPPRARGGARPDFAAAARARDRPAGGAHDGAQAADSGRRRHQRPAGQQRDPHQRDAGLVRRGTPGRHAARRASPTRRPARPRPRAPPASSLAGVQRPPTPTVAP